ncbi:MAG: dUTP diphosphatase [Mycoplasmataceae bacterium]|jgi:dimeric dUTPase (all-alpha-NTP-PPase superfamily)|nr:dUTP diphosphatase [Mycoplasmataceae bacterium]
MIISLSEILIKQQQLDKYIYDHNNVGIEDVKQELLLATIVELAEFANEVRSFKFWSKRGMNSKEDILEEYVDGIHFISSFANYYRIDPIFNLSNIRIILDKRVITNEFNKLFYLLTKINYLKPNDYNAKLIKKYIKQYILLGLGLGIKFDEIKEAYDKKYEINIKRQDSGTY